MRILSKNFSIYFAVFVLLFSLACSKKVSNSSGEPGVMTTSNLSCRFTPSFTTFGGNAFISGFSSGGTYAVDYVCEKAGAAVADAECRGPVIASMASSQSLTACNGSGTITIPSSTASGIYSLSVRGKDASTGNFSNTYTFDFAIDAIAPTVSADIVETSRTTQSVGISFLASDATSPTAPSSGMKSVQCLITAANTLPASPVWEDCASGEFTKRALTPATNYKIFFRAEDNALNTNIDSDGGVDFYAIQTEAEGGGEPPHPGLPGLCQITTNFSNDYTKELAVPIHYSCPNTSLVNQCVFYSTSGAAPILQNCAEFNLGSGDYKYQAALPSDGGYEFCVTDGPGGIVRCKSFSRDRTVPTVSISNLVVTTVSATATLTGQDSGSGISRFTCALLNKETDKIYNVLGQEVASIDAALNDTLVPCGSMGVNTTSVTFNAGLIAPRSEYVLFAKSHDKVGLMSSYDSEEFLVSQPAALVCSILNARNGEWKNSSDQNYEFECVYPSLTHNMNFKCSVENPRNGLSNSIGCTVSEPACLVSDDAVDPFQACYFRGSFRTQGLASSFVVSGDTLRVRVQAQDKASSGNVIASSTVDDTFKVDTAAPVVPQITVNASKDEVQISYTANDPGAPLRGSGLRDGVVVKLFKLPDLENPLSPLDYDLNISGNDLRFGPRNFNPANNYKVTLTAVDNVENVSVASSLVFPGPNPNVGPSCSITLLDGYSVNPASPTASLTTRSQIICTNPFEEAPSESNHTSRAFCRTTSKDILGNSVMSSWTNCTGTNANLVDMTPFTWIVQNNSFHLGEVKLEVYACDSTYTYRCGAVSSVSYYYGPGRNGGWGAEETIYLGGDSETHYKQKTCNNPTPYPASDATRACAVESGWTMGVASVEGYKTEYKVVGTCQNYVDYVFDRLLNKCVSRVTP